MNILFYLRDFPGHDDYGRDYTEVAKMLQASGHRVTALVTRDPPASSVNGIECRRFPGRGQLFFGFADLNRALADVRPPGGWDACLVVEWWNLNSHLVARSAAHSGIPVLFSPWASLNPAALSRDRRQFFKRLAILASRVFHGKKPPTLQLYADVDRRYVRELGISWPTMTATLPIYDNYGPHSVSFDWERALEMPLNGRRILFFNARFDIWQKGYDYLLKGFEQASIARGKDFRTLLVISGRDPDGPIKGQLAEAEQMAQTLCRAGHAVWKGYLSQQERSDMLAHCDMFAYPSRVDGPPRPLREALWRGTPLMVTYETGLADWIERFGAGIPVRAPTEEGVKNAVLQFDQMNDQSLRATREKAIVLAKRLNLENVARDYEQALIELKQENAGSKIRTEKTRASI